MGRDTELEQLGEALAEGVNRHVLVSGLPGVGKTALAVTWVALHRENFADGQLYVDFQGYGPTPGPSVDAALERLIPQVCETLRNGWRPTAASSPDDGLPS